MILSYNLAISLYIQTRACAESFEGINPMLSLFYINIIFEDKFICVIIVSWRHEDWHYQSALFWILFNNAQI